jgi:polyhydroxyalkanoate synthesis regulator phasin
MTVELWQAALAMLAPLLLAASVAMPKILTVRAANRRTDAVTLATAYGHAIDRLEGEVTALRDQVTNLMGLVGTRDSEIATLRAELATERAEKTMLRGRVDELERQVHRLPKRTDDPRGIGGAASREGSRP